MNKNIYIIGNRESIEKYFPGYIEKDDTRQSTSGDEYLIEVRPEDPNLKNLPIDSGLNTYTNQEIILYLDKSPKWNNESDASKIKKRGKAAKTDETEAV